jgi:hypothetical protein
VKYIKQQKVAGVTYSYFRDRAGRLTKLNGAVGSPQFKAEYDVCLRRMLGEANEQPPRIKDAKDTVAKAIEIYLASTKFAGLAASTRQRSARTCELIRASELGRARLRDIDARLLNRYSEGIAKRHGKSVADRHIHVLSSIWRAALNHDEFGTHKLANPADAAESHYRVQREHRPWPVEVQAQFMATAPEYLQRAKMLLHFSLQRGGDCTKMRWSDYDGECLAVRQEKTHGERAAEPIYIAVPDPLRDMLDASPRLADTILVNGDGHPFANASVLSKAIHRHLIRIGARGYVMHGLRKTGAIDVVMSGGGVSDLKSYGWKSSSQALYYVNGCDSRRVNRNAVDRWNAELRTQIEKRERDRRVAARRSNIKAVA